MSSTNAQLQQLEQMQQLQQKAEQILQTGIFAGSARLHSLFQYLLRCSLAGYAPKEFEVAIDGMGQSADFDVTQDSLVRVHIHKLRRKLAEAQAVAETVAQQEPLLVLPRGEYRFILLPPTATNPLSDSVPAAAASILPQQPGLLRPLQSGFALAAYNQLVKAPLQQWFYRLALVLPWFVILYLLLMADVSNPKIPPQNLLDQQLLPFKAQSAPVLLVLGDYYLFAEADAQGQVQRLVRQFDVNSPLQLLQSQQTEPELAAQQFDLGLSYLPTSVATALAAVSAALDRQHIRYDLVLASSLNPAQLQHQPVIYLGQLSGLGPLQQEWQQQAQFQPDGSFDELVDQHSGQRYRNATPLTPPDTLPEYGYLNSWHNDLRQPRLLLTGLRDGGLVALSQYLSQVAPEPSSVDVMAVPQEWLWDQRTKTAVRPGLPQQ